jgi:hypothetical protein
MDPLEPLLITALSRVGEGSLGAAGAQLWEELKSLVRKRGDDEAVVAFEQRAAEIDPAALAKALTLRAISDPDLHLELERWQANVERQVDGDISNTVIGRVQGKVVQARDIGSLRIE